MNYSSNCSLCEASISSHPIREGDALFCCPGCRVVYNILFSRGKLEQFVTEPVFVAALQSGLISNPELLAEIQRKQPESNAKERLHFEVGDLWCPSCAEVIRLVLMRKRGLGAVVVDYATDLACVEYDPMKVSKEEIFSSISDLGYRPIPFDQVGRKQISFQLLLRFLIGAFCTLNIMMLSYPLYASYFDSAPQKEGTLIAWLSFTASLPVVTYCLWPILKRAWSSLLVGVTGMEALVALGVSSAFSVSLWNLMRGSDHVYFDSMSMVVTLVLLGKIIEAKAKFSAKEALFSLARSLPKKGRKRFEDGTEAYVLAKDLEVGDIVVVKTGEKIVLDGCVIEGEGAADESLLTGEALPSAKKEGEFLLGGSVLQQGWLAYRVTSNEESSTLKQIISLVERGLQSHPIELRAVDGVVKQFVPAVLILAAGVWVFKGGLTALTLLLIACPCAIGLAAPLAESLLLHRLASLGAIIRNRTVLRHLGRETLFVFDKTGTITEGKYRVTRGTESMSSAEKGLLKSLAAKSHHPIAIAIEQSLDAPAFPLQHFEEFAGRGVRCFFEQTPLALGSAQFIEELGILPPMPANSYFLLGEQLFPLYLEDRIRDDAPQAINALKPARTFLLSGDNPDTVAKVAKKCGFDRWKAECHPLDKREEILKLRQEGEIVAMLGDGINDAPAIAAADIGISVVNATDMAIQVSDILLTTSDLNLLPEMRKIARKGRRILNQNLFWAFFYNIIGLFLAALGLLTPLFATFAMIASSLLVIFNSLRLLKK